MSPPPLVPWPRTRHAAKNLYLKTAHSAYHIANEMACAHNCMIRGLNALWLQSPHIRRGSDDISDFLLFASSWGTWVLNHFRLEDELMFAGFEAAAGVAHGTLPTKVDRQSSFIPAIRAFVASAESSNDADYDGRRFRELLQTFADSFVTHLHEEIPLLLGLDVCGESGSGQLRAVLDRGEEHAAMQDKFVVPPMVMGLHDGSYEGGNNWPAVPWGTLYVVNYVLAWKHRGAWRFLPSDHWRRPRALAFGGLAEVTGAM